LGITKKPPLQRKQTEGEFTMRMYDIIYKKREGKSLTAEEINFFVSQYVKGNIPDYQVSALLMAIYFQQMNKDETYFLTEAMRKSGNSIDLSSIDGIKVDKHSTGGVGDTTTLIVGPLVASCGVPVAKMSGTSLGYTGGTIDKLKSIPGFNMELPIEKFIDIVNTVKLSIISQSKDLAPADKQLYALRDVTATVENRSLIASSIMSKKLASGSDAMVLDVKFGNGAFMKTLKEGIELAQEMVSIGAKANKSTLALLTNMDQPLGFAVGNTLEVKEAIHVLKNRGSEDLKKLSLYLASYMLLLGKKVQTVEEGFKLAQKKLLSGEAFHKFKEFVIAHGGDISVIDHTDRFPTSKYKIAVTSISEGYIDQIKTDSIGLAALILGAGRNNKESMIDVSAGIILNKKIGDKVEYGETLAILHTNKKQSISEAYQMILKSFHFSKDPIAKPKLLHGMVIDHQIKLFSDDKIN
jgi:pyrimidine-nucleoside phosphorylase